METIAKNRTQQILTVMHILAWVSFIGLLIESGAIVISYSVSLVNPEGAKNLFRGLNLYNLRQFSLWYYTMSVSFLVALASMKAFVSYLVIKVLSKISLANPFTMEVARKLERISHAIFGIWLVAMLHNAHTAWLMKKVGELHETWISGEFIFVAALIFVISQIFKRGVEIQSENELTV